MSHAERSGVVDPNQPDEDDIPSYRFAPLQQRPTLTNAARPNPLLAVTPPPSTKKSRENRILREADSLDYFGSLGTVVKADSLLLLDPIAEKLPNHIAITSSEGECPKVGATAASQQGGQTGSVQSSKRRVAEQKARQQFRAPNGRQYRTRAMGAGCDDALLELQGPLAASSGVAGMSSIARRRSGRDTDSSDCDIPCDCDCDCDCF